MIKVQKTGFPLLLLSISLGYACQNKSDSKELPFEKPNIIYILVDDLGYGDLGCFGQKILKTPQIDLLASEGMIFNRHYAGSTVCAPSRASLMTGKHVEHCSVRGNHPEGMLIKDEELTIAEVLKEAGYATGMEGKWGIGHPPPYNDPFRNGFDYANGYINMWHAHNCFPDFLIKNGQKYSTGNVQTEESYEQYGGHPEGRGMAKIRKSYAPMDFIDGTLSFIEHHQDRPFFMMLNLNLPHANNEAEYMTGNGMEIPSIEAFTSMPWPEQEKAFAAIIKFIDEGVGAINEKIKSLGLEDNTIIIFTSDNGPHNEGGHQADFFDSNGPLRGAKRDLYEGGIRVPMIVKWKGRVAPNCISDHVSAFWDVLPTFCDIVKINPPATTDGISFLPEMLGQEQAKHEYLYWEFYEEGGKQAVLKNDFKYIKLNLRRENGAEVQSALYHLTEDIGEQNNIINLHPKLVEEMEAILQKEHKPFSFIELFSED